MNLHWDLLLPEIVLTVAVLGIFVQSLGLARGLNPAAWLPVAALLSGLAALASVPADAVQMFYGTYQVDGLSQLFKLGVGLGLAVVCANGVRLAQVEAHQRADYFLFLALAGWGLTVLASSVELVTVVVALEVSSFALYGLVPLRGQSRAAAEAGIKYVLFGAAATGLSLYGLGLVLATVGTSFMDQLAGASLDFAANPVAAVGLALFVFGFIFKLALFPFHFWAPDVYGGTANETAAAVATLPKLGAVVVLVRLAQVWAGGELPLLLAVLGAASMTFGNLMALAQTDVKRLLGYSGVAHAGYLTLGLAAGTSQGLGAATFYALVYVLMNLAIFWVVCRFAPDGENLHVDDLAGMYRRAPALALTLAVSAFALVGLPPTAGFIGKLFLLTAAWDAGYGWLVVVAALNTAVAIFYYLNLVRHAYTRDPAEARAPVGATGPVASGVALVLAGAILALGCLPGPAFDVAVEAAMALAGQ